MKHYDQCYFLKFLLNMADCFVNNPENKMAGDLWRSTVHRFAAKYGNSLNFCDFFLVCCFLNEIMKILQIMKLVTRLAQKGRGRVTVNYHFHSLGLILRC